MKYKTRDLIKINPNTINEIERKYVKDILNYKGGYAIFNDISIDGIPLKIAIIKDKISAINDSNKKFNFRKRPYIVLFLTSIDTKKYINVFGPNYYTKNALNLNKNISEFDTINDNIYKDKHSNKTKIYWKFFDLIQNYLFKKIKSEYNYIFVNSYVYISVCLNNEDEYYFSNYYFNTNYSFKRCNGSKITLSGNINKYSYFVYDIDNELNNMKRNSLDMKNLLDAYQGKLEINNITYQNYQNIVNGIKNNEQNIFIKGFARSGKTIIAMRLLHDYPDSMLYLMNPHFYNSLKRYFNVQNVEFPTNRIKSGLDFISNGNAVNREGYNILIVDEAQRASIPFAFESFRPSFKTRIFLGDSFQKIRPKYDTGLEGIIKICEEKEEIYSLHLFDYSIGIPRNILQAARYLSFLSNLKSDILLNTFSINIFDSEDNFINKYRGDSCIKKHMATIYIGNNDFNSTIKEFSRMHKRIIESIEYFLDEDVKNNNILTTYELISRELDNIYIVLPKEVGVNNNLIVYLPDNTKDEALRNQIYTLITRARGEVNILCQNNDLYKLLNSKVEILKNNNDNLFDLEKLDTDVQETIKELNDKIENHGITRLIHFTNAENLNSILEKGILPRSQLNNENIKYEANDELRLENALDSISLSIQNPNLKLLDSFKRKYPNNKYYVLLLDPALLYELFDESNKSLIKREYCTNNAAYSNCKRSETNIDYMFNDKIHDKYQYFYRSEREINETTDLQAEILFYGRIPPKYIIDYEEI